MTKGKRHKIMGSDQPYSSDPRIQNYQQPPDEAYGSTIQSENAGGAYVQRERQSYVDPTGNRVENRAEVYEDANQSRANTRYWITRITYFILSVLEVILALRFVFRLLGAHESNSFINFLYGLSHVFVAPFNGIFNDQALGTSSVFEISTIIAMLVYALIAWGIVSLGRVAYAPVVSGRRSVNSTRRRTS
jgi:YGGT family